MNVKIAGFKTLPLNQSSYNSKFVTIFDHEPVTKDFIRITSWVEVELPDLPEPVIQAAAVEQTDAKVAELEKQIEALRAEKAARVAA